jgi:hypothetical protein
MLKSETSDTKDPKKDVEEVEQQNLIRTFKRLTKFQTCTEIEICIYQGAKEFGHQCIPFHQACDIVHSSSIIRTVSLSCSEVKDYKLTEDYIMNWLLEGDIHFIIINQGIVNINMHKLYASIMKLHYHPGFPVGDSLQSPVFTQDKYKYLSILMSKKNYVTKL